MSVGSGNKKHLMVGYVNSVKVNLATITLEIYLICRYNLFIPADCKLYSKSDCKLYSKSFKTVTYSVFFFLN